MFLRPRTLLLLLCLAASGCIGGPTSDWPRGASSDSDDEASGPATRDAGRKPAIDGGVVAPTEAAETPCSPESDAGVVITGTLDAGPRPASDASLPDAGCAQPSPVPRL